MKKLMILVLVLCFVSSASAATLTVTSTDDNRARDTMLNTTYTGSDIGFYGGVDSESDGYIKFDISGIPDGQAIVSATYNIQVRCDYASGPTGDLYAVADDSWSESTLTWNNRPTMGSKILSWAITGMGGSGGVPNQDSLDVTSYVTAQYSGNGGNDLVSFGLDSAATIGTPFTQGHEVSDAYSPHNQLVVVYTIADPTKAISPSPVDDANYVDSDAALSWVAGNRAQWHDIYLGTDFDDVNDANTSSPCYQRRQEQTVYVHEMEFMLGTTYYWRIDEVNDSNIYKGDVWQFTANLLPEGYILYVATNGNDSNDGSKESPFATIARAQQAVRSLSSLINDVYIYIRGGTYLLTQPLTFTSADSGTPTYEITYQSYPGENAVISGGKTITGWQQDTGDPNLYKVYLPDVDSDQWYFRQLFVNDQRREKTRLPSSDYYYIDDIINDSNRDDPNNRTGFRFSSGDIDRSWSNLGDVEIINLFSWSEMRMPIDYIDSVEDIVYYTGRTGTGYRLPDWAGGRYFVENVFEALDSPGQWYLNRETGWLYYWPMPGENMSEVEVIAPVVDKLIRFDGNVASDDFVEHITLRNLTLCHSDWILPYNGYAESQASVEVRTWMETDWITPPYGKPVGAIYAVAAKNCTIEGSVLKHIGGWAIEFLNGCKDNSVIDNHIYSLGAGAVKIGEYWWATSDAEEADGMVVSNNYIHHGGNVYLGAVGIWIGNSGDNLLSHNIIHDLNYSGISIGWSWGCANTRTQNNIIEYNHVYDLLKGMLHDGGGVYMLGKASGSIIRNNIFHDIYGSGQLSRGIYFDQGGSYVHVENNIVYNVANGTAAGGGDIYYENNIFAFATEWQLWWSAGVWSACGPRDRFWRNIVYWDDIRDGDAYAMIFYDVTVPEDVVQKSENNVFHNAGDGDFRIEGSPITTFSQWQALGFDSNSTSSDPLFVDVDNYDFRLDPCSPALALGFNPIDTNDVGVVPQRPSLILRLSGDGNDVLITGRCEPWTTLVSAKIREDNFDVVSLLNFEANGNIAGTVPMSSLNTDAVTLEMVISDPDGDISEPGLSNTLSFAPRIKASRPKPPHGALDLLTAITLNWLPGANSVSHDIYFGTNETLVTAAARLASDVDGSGVVDFNDMLVITQLWLQDPIGSEPYAGLSGDSTVDLTELVIVADGWRQQADPVFKGNQIYDANSYDAGTLARNTIYYWRIDEVNGPNTVKGNIWQFKTYQRSR